MFTQRRKTYEIFLFGGEVRKLMFVILVQLYNWGRTWITIGELYLGCWAGDGFGFEKNVSWGFPGTLKSLKGRSHELPFFHWGSSFFCIYCSWSSFYHYWIHNWYKPRVRATIFGRIYPVWNVTKITRTFNFWTCSSTPDPPCFKFQTHLCWKFQPTPSTQPYRRP